MPPGKFEFSKDLPRTITLKPGETVQLDFDIDTGIRLADGLFTGNQHEVAGQPQGFGLLFAKNAIQGRQGILPDARSSAQPEQGR